MFWPKYKKWEGKWSLLMWQWFQWHLWDHLFPPTPFFCLWSTLGQSQGTPQASLGLLLSCHRAGQLLQLARKTSTTCWGQEVRELAELLRDVGPVERQASLEYTEVGSFYICLCVYVYVVQAVVMCVWACCPYVYNKRAYVVEKQKMLFKVKGLTLLVSVTAIWARS